MVAMPRELTDIATPALTYLSGLAQARGLEIAIADPGDLVFRDDRLRLDGREVDVLVRAFSRPCSRTWPSASTGSRRRCGRGRCA